MRSAPATAAPLFVMVNVFRAELLSDMATEPKSCAAEGEIVNWAVAFAVRLRTLTPPGVEETVSVVPAGAGVDYDWANDQRPIRRRA